MNLRHDSPQHDASPSDVSRHHCDRGAAGARGSRSVAGGLIVAAILAASGCKLGTTSSPLTWWPGGSKGAKDNEKLASAPSFDGKVEKPSATQTPYPTTTTPQSYALDGKAPPVAATAMQSPGAQPPSFGSAPGGYGLTPPPTTSAATAPPAAPPTEPPPAGGVAAQVGPYQGWPAGGSSTTGSLASAPPQAPGSSVSAVAPPAEPAAAASPSAGGSSAALGFGSASAMTPDAVAPPTRYADSRFGDPSASAAMTATASPANGGGSSSFSSPAAAAPAAVVASESQPPAADLAVGVPSSRYSTGGSSRFASDPTAIPDQPAAVVPPEAQATMSGPPPVSPPSPAAGFADPSAFSPPSGMNKLRSSPASAGPPVPPGRRPDPGYRPGGTSTYRPSQAIVDDPVETDGGVVRQASFDSPLR